MKGTKNQSNYILRFHSIHEYLMSKTALTIKKRGLTQKQAADLLCVSQPRISDLTRGKSNRFTIDMLFRMLLALEEHVQVFVCDSNEKTPLDHTDEAKEQKLEYLSNVLNVAPKNHSALMNRGDIYLDLCKYDLAIGDYSRAIELCPNIPGPRNQRALAFIKSGQINAAMLDSEILIEKFPKYSGGYAQRAQAYLVVQQPEKALADLSKVIQLDPASGPYWNRGQVYESLNQKKRAIRDYKKVIKLERNSKHAEQAVKRLSKKV